MEWSEIAGYLGIAGTVCAAISTKIPAPAADAGSAYRCIYALINFVGFNFGKAKNADDAEAARKLR